MAIESLGPEAYNATAPAQATNDIWSRALSAPPPPSQWSLRKLVLETPAALFVAIVAYVLCTRIIGLSHKVMHHDESLFAYYGYWLFRGNGYDYQPILHGPVLQYLSAFFFLLFGDDQFTMRLPSLLGGLAMFPVVWFWRRYLGLAGTLAAFTLIALSPSITYYTRFLRNDVPYLTVTMWCALCLLRALQTGAPRYIAASILSATLAFSMMESSIFFFAACTGFFCVVVLTDWVRGGSLEGRLPVDPRIVRTSTRAWDVMSCIGAGLLVTLVAGWLFHRVLYSSIHLYKPVVALAHKVHLRPTPAGSNIIIAIIFLVAATLFSWVTLLNFRKPRGREGIYHGVLHILWQNRWTLVASLAAAVALYEVLFTTFFTFTETKSFDHGARDFAGPVRALTPVQIYQNTWDYWWDQHKLHRIKGPFHYYLPILFLYELPVLALVLWGWFRAVWLRPERWLHVWIFIAVQLGATFLYLLATRMLLHADDPQQAVSQFWEWMDKTFHLSHGFHLTLILLYCQLLLHIVPLLFATGRRIEAFLSFWCVTSLFAYSYAGEKVPWLTVHVAGPMCLLASMQVARIWNARALLAPATRRVLTVAACIALLYQVRTQHYLNFINPASPAERLVYNHTSPDVQEALDIVDQVGRETHFGKQLPIFMQGEMAWPLHWYLRHYPNMLPPASETLDTTTRPLVLIDWASVDNENLKENYWIRRMKVREWWEPPLLDFGALLDIYRVFTPLESRDPEHSGLNYAQYQRAIAEWRKLWHYLAYREIWIDPFNPDWSNGANEFAFGIRKDLKETYLTQEWLSQLAKRRDVPIYP